MTKVVAAHQIQSGDQVEVKGSPWIVKAIDGPDFNGAYDFYLTNGHQDSHAVITEAVNLLIS